MRCCCAVCIKYQFFKHKRSFCVAAGPVLLLGVEQAQSRCVVKGALWKRHISVLLQG